MQDVLKLEFGSQQFEYDKDYLIYADFRKKAINIATNSSLVFIEEYRKFKELDVLIKQGFYLGNLIINQVIEHAVKDCIELEMYDVNVDVFMAHDYDNNIWKPWLEVCSFINDQYVDIECAKKSEEERRAFRKATRLQLVGGGFGLQGAAVGILKAGAVNAVTGIAHSIFNSIGNAWDSMNAYKKKCAIYENENTLKALQSALSQSILNVYDNLAINLLKLNVNNEGNIRKFNAIMDNLRENRIPEDKVHTTLFELLKLNPMNFSIYERLDECVVDEKSYHDFLNFKKIFGICDYEVLNIKVNNALNEADHQIAEMQLKAVDGTDDDKLALLKYCLTYDLLTNKKKYVSETTKLINCLIGAKHTDSLIFMAKRLIYMRHSYENIVPNAIEFYKSAIENGSARAAYELGKLYYEGEAIKKDIETADNYFKKSMELSTANDAYIVAEMYQHGYGVNKDEKKAKEYYEKAVELDSVEFNSDEAALQLARFALIEEYTEDSELDCNKYAGDEAEIQLALVSMVKDKENKSNYYYQLILDRYSDKKSHVVADMYALGEFVYQDIEKADEIYKKIVIFGDADILHKHFTSFLLYRGKLSDNEKDRKVYYTLAMHLGSKQAVARIAIDKIENFNGTDADLKKCEELFEQAIDYGDTEAAIAIGDFYLKRYIDFYKRNDITYPYYLEKAVQYFCAAQKLGDPLGAKKLGDICLDSNYEIGNESQAIEYYIQAGDLGDNEGYECAAKIYLESKYDNNVQEALKLYEKALSQGSSSAALELGEIYSTIRYGNKDFSKAIEYYVKAGDLGYREGYFKAAKTYMNSEYELKNALEAIKYFEKTGDLGDSEGYLKIAEIYLDNEIGLNDAYKAVEYLQKAVKADNAEAMCILGSLYENGTGIEQNYDKALSLYQKAWNLQCAKAAYLLGKYSLKTGDVDNALNWFLLACDKHYSDAFYSAAEIFYSKKDYANAHMYYWHASKKFGYEEIAEAKMKELMENEVAKQEIEKNIESINKNNQTNQTNQNNIRIQENIEKVSNVKKDDSPGCFTTIGGIIFWGLIIKWLFF